MEWNYIKINIYLINHGLNSIDGERFEIFEIIKEKNDVKYLNYIILNQ